MPIKLHFLSSFIPKKKSFSQGRRGEWKDLSFGHIISSHHLQRELEGNKHFTFINFINLLLFSKRQQQVARIEAWSSRKFLFYYCRRQKLPIGSEIRLLCQRAQDDCRVHISWHQSWYILMVGGFVWNKLETYVCGTETEHVGPLVKLACTYRFFTSRPNFVPMYT